MRAAADMYDRLMEIAIRSDQVAFTISTTAGDIQRSRY